MLDPRGEPVLGPPEDFDRRCPGDQPSEDHRSTGPLGIEPRTFLTAGIDDACNDFGLAIRLPRNVQRCESFLVPRLDLGTSHEQDFQTPRLRSVSGSVMKSGPSISIPSLDGSTAVEERLDDARIRLELGRRMQWGH